MTSRKTTSRAVTLQDIADRCGLSLFTVSLALRGDTRVKAATAERVREAAEALGYDPARNQAARRLALMRHGREVLHHVVALYVPANVEEVPYYNRLFWGVLHGLTANGFAMLVSKFPKGDETTPDLTALFRQGDIDGIIVPENPASDPRVQGLRTLGGRTLPLVSMIWPSEGGSSVVADDMGGTCAAVRHLLELGHRHILYLYQATTILGDLRIAGARQALAEAGLDPDAHLHLMPSFPRWVDPFYYRSRRDSGEDPADHPLPQWLRAHPEVTALLAWNDGIALNAWYTLEGAGLRVPQDISIVGFDDTEPMQGPDGQNLLTCVRVPLREIGVQAGQLIARRITGAAPTDERIVLPTELVVRASTAPPR